MCDHRISDIFKYKMQTAVGNPKNSRTRNASNYVDTLPRRKCDLPMQKSSFSCVEFTFCCYRTTLAVFYI